MSEESQKKELLNTNPYKGVRDFYPKEMALHRYILDTMARVSERFGYQEYSSSVLEPTELYEAKSSQEIVSEQTYTFTDRGERGITLRPEMTPSVARMVAAKRRELSFPLRLYSTPNIFRYERPQRGRIREHWQLNADIFGVSNIEADIEIISLAHAVMREFGASQNDFVIRVSSRALMNRITKHFSIGENKMTDLVGALDKKGKVSAGELKTLIDTALGDMHELGEMFLEFAEDGLSALPEKLQESEEAHELEELVQRLMILSIKNVVVDTGVVRGFEYYSGIVFEVFDTSPLNSRSLFGGGRYDDLLSVFGADPIPAVGFGMGDVTIEDFLDTHNLLPNYRAKTLLYIALIDEDCASFAHEIAQNMREHNINVEVDFSMRKLGDQIKTADKHGVRFMLPLGAEEKDRRALKVKELDNGIEHDVSLLHLAEFLKDES